MPLIPVTQTPAISLARSLARGHSRSDAIAVLIIGERGKPKFTNLPTPDQWTLLHQRSRAEAGEVRSCTLPTPRQTQAVLGYISAKASPFEQLAMAGRMLREALARKPQTLALAVLNTTDAQGVARSASRGGGSAPLPESALEALLSAALVQDFPLPTFRSKPSRARRLSRIVLQGGGALDLPRILATARAQNLARWLTALPPNKLDAASYRRMLRELAARHRLKLRWLDEAALRRAGAGAFLAVAAGNARRDAAGIAHLSYRPARRRTRATRGSARAPDVALIGKGILFDTGGTNLKPHRGMLDMHTDMAGSAVALASLIALAEQRSPIAADAWLAITENRIGPTAYQPQDILRAANGTTIQVIHTDAEGRLALADTLVLAGRSKPQLMIDYATLTGAAVYALTERMSAVFCRDARLSGPLLAAGRISGERVVQFPLDADFDADIESKIADVAQCAVEGKGDHIIAARFLQRFVPEKMPWIHVDLSSATRSGGLGHVLSDVIGFGVRLTLEFLQGQNALAALRRADPEPS